MESPTLSQEAERAGCLHAALNTANCCRDYARRLRRAAPHDAEAAPYLDLAHEADALADTILLVVKEGGFHA